MALPVPAALQSAERPVWPSSVPDLRLHEVLVIDYRTVTRVDPIIDHDYAKAALKQKLRVMTMWSENENSTLAHALGIHDIKLRVRTTRNTFSSSNNLNAEAALLAPLKANR